MKPLLLFLALLLFTACANAQPAAPEAPAALSPAEQRVQEIIAEDGIHVVHFWSPWCGNSLNELSGGWYEVIEENPDVSFTFVTIFNYGDSGRPVMEQYAIPGEVEELLVPGPGPASDDFYERSLTFLGRPVTWTPTTWIFHRNGELAFAFHYGEVSPDLLRQMLTATRSDWHHE